MSKFWMITNRNRTANGLGMDRAELTFWLSEQGPLDAIGNWRKVKRSEFRRELISAANGFPACPDPADHEGQKHVTIFVHGYNNDWADAARRYQKICDNLYAGENSLGIVILFTWPSDGSPLNYLPDRSDARESANDLADVLCAFYDWLLRKQAAAAAAAAKACRAKVSIIAHSMGNYVTQKAMHAAWTRKNQPLLISLVNQLVMVAADVDNDLFEGKVASDGMDGEAMTNLTYRITALYTGRDPVLCVSAGLKHFGVRRLGRSGLADRSKVPDNVWDIDCSKLFPPDQKEIHSAYFDVAGSYELMRQILRGVDRSIIDLP